MVERVVVDTDVISFIFKGQSQAAAYVPYLEGKQIVVSFMTVAELKRWALKKRWGPERITKLNQQLRQVVVYAVDLDVCQSRAGVMMAAENRGRPISPQDAWVAATALREDLPLVTNNFKDFDGIPKLQVISR